MSSKELLPWPQVEFTRQPVCQQRGPSSVENAMYWDIEILTLSAIQSASEQFRS
jgi:hypothetical protein